MQPYLFPYIGYLQLIDAVDKFVVYDDVNYIKKGWINRNRILISGNPKLFTLPLKGASQNKLINEIELSDSYHDWKQKFLRTLEMNYKKAINYDEAMIVVTEILSFKCSNLSDFIVHSLNVICCYLDIDTEIVDSSVRYGNRMLKGQDRILDICKKENSKHYINPVGGVELYNLDVFERNEIKINFINSDGESHYKQFGDDFSPWLSIIDVMMFNSRSDAKVLLKEYGLV
ncbi:WbqC family protein [Vibrio genomosp. F10 str. 9ZC157]|nr:WbqC family protein [Vibrio genomosp. F10]